MTKIVLLGCGFHGRGIAYQLAREPGVELKVLDRNEALAAEVGRKAGVPSATVDVNDATGLAAALAGADAVVNAVGPYHRSALRVIEAALAAGIHYIDMADDHEVAEAVLLDPQWEARAKAAGVTVLIACGVVPGLSGMLVSYGTKQLDRTDSVRVRFGWNYSRQYPAAIQHFLRINSGRGPQLVDGTLVRKAPLEGREEVDFLAPVGRTAIYYTGVPDPVGIARFVPGVRQATSKGAFYQDEANRLLGDMIRWGFTAYDPPAGEPTAPMDYLVRYLGSPAGERFFEIPRREVPLAVRVDIEGEKDGRPATLSFEAHDHSRRATTAFTAQAALAVAKGELAPGTLSPEGWPTPGPFLAELLKDLHIDVFTWRDGGTPAVLAPSEALVARS